jgi:hypothetical protein
MGYDMYRVLSDEERAEPWAEEYQRCKDSWWKLDDREASRVALDRSGALETEYGIYFRLNIFGMSRYREAMERLDMVFWPREGTPEFPKLEQYGLTEWPDEDDPAPRTDAQRAYLAAVEQVTDGPCLEETPGIPGYKLASNDGWLVRPVELSTALALYRDHGEPIPENVEPDYWTQWINFLEQSAASGGFRVR